MNHILHGLRKFFKSKAFIITTIIFFVLLILFMFIVLPIISVLGPETFFRGMQDYISVLVDAKLYVVLMILFIPIIVLLSLFPLASLIYPCLVAFFERCFRYPSLFFSCVRHGYSFKINNFKFSCIDKIDESANVIIKKRGKRYFLHFLDVTKADKKVLVITDEGEYRIYETTKAEKISVSKYDRFMENEDIPKVFRRRSRIMNEDCYVSFKMSVLKKSDSESHIVLISPRFVYAKYYSKPQMLDIGREVSIGATSFAKLKFFKKNL